MQPGRIVMGCALAIGCAKGGAPKTRNEVDVFEGDLGRPYHGAYVGRAGLYVDHTLVAPAKDLASEAVIHAALISAKPPLEMLVLDVDDEPLAVGAAVLHATIGMTIDLALRVHDGSRASKAFRRVAIRAQPPADPGRPTLSIEVLTDRVFLGHSTLREFRQVNNTHDEVDFANVEAILKELKASPDFAARTDLELAVAPGLTSRPLVFLVDIAGDVGFSDIAVVAPEQLTARADLPTAVDFTGLATADQVTARMREHLGPDGFSPHLGADELCLWITVTAPPPTPANKVKEPPGTAHHVALVRNSGSVWLAYSFVPDPKDPEPGRTHRAEEIGTDRESLRGAINNNRIGSPVKDAVLEIAIEDAVDGAALLSVVRSACAAGVHDIALRKPAELSIQPE